MSLGQPLAPIETRDPDPDPAPPAVYTTGPLAVGFTDPLFRAERLYIDTYNIDKGPSEVRDVKPLITGIAFVTTGTTYQGYGFVPLIGGSVLVVDPDGNQQSVPFISLCDEVKSDGDRGLLGLAIHPGFDPEDDETGWIYLAYTVSQKPGEDTPFCPYTDYYGWGRVARFRAGLDGDGNIVWDDEATTPRVNLLGDEDGSGNLIAPVVLPHEGHSMCWLRFGIDGSLIVGTGDGEAHAGDCPGADPEAFDPGGIYEDFANEDTRRYRAQDLRSLSGKILRINPENGDGYANNPFRLTTESLSANRSRIWATGLRHPFRLSIKPDSQTSTNSVGTVFLGEVSQDTWEEINVTYGGENFGWPFEEGFDRQPGYLTVDELLISCGLNTSCTIAGCDLFEGMEFLASTTLPFFAWPHEYIDEDWRALPNPLPGSGTQNDFFFGRTAIGGVHYPTTSTLCNYPSELRGAYFFADFEGSYLSVSPLDGVAESDRISFIRYVTTTANDLITSTGLFTTNSLERHAHWPIMIETHPVSGDLYVVALALNDIYRVRYNRPQAVLTTDRTHGSGLPFRVHFDASASVDGEGVAHDGEFAFDFGDGTTMTSAGPAVYHDYTTRGLMRASVTITTGGHTSRDVVWISPDNEPPQVRITEPSDYIYYYTRSSTSPVVLSATGADDHEDQEDLVYRWSADLKHNAHDHPGYGLNAYARTTTFSECIAHAAGVSSYYYTLRLRAQDSAGLGAEDHMILNPEEVAPNWLTPTDDWHKSLPPRLEGVSVGGNIISEHMSMTSHPLNGMDPEELFHSPLPDVWYRLDAAELKEHPDQTLIDVSLNGRCSPMFLAIYEAACPANANYRPESGPDRPLDHCSSIDEVAFNDVAIWNGMLNYNVSAQHYIDAASPTSASIYIRAGMDLCELGDKLERITVRVVPPGALDSYPIRLESGHGFTGNMQWSTDMFDDPNHPGSIDKYFEVEVPAQKKLLVKGESDSVAKSIRVWMGEDHPNVATPICTVAESLPWILAENMEGTTATARIVFQTASAADSVSLSVECVPYNLNEASAVVLPHSQTIIGDLAVHANPYPWQELDCLSPGTDSFPMGWFKMWPPFHVYPPAGVPRIQAYHAGEISGTRGVELDLLSNVWQGLHDAACSVTGSPNPATLSYENYRHGSTAFVKVKHFELTSPGSAQLLSVDVDTVYHEVPFGNDECVNAIELQCGQSITTAIATYATTSSLAPPSGCPQARDVWFVVRSENNTTHSHLAVEFDDDPHSYTNASEYTDTNYIPGYVAIYEYPPCEGWNAVLDSRCGRMHSKFSIAPVCVHTNTLYYIRVASNSNSPNQTITISCEAKLDVPCGQ